jgi:adenine-specific DNA-methyltransferase
MGVIENQLALSFLGSQNASHGMTHRIARTLTTLGRGAQAIDAREIAPAVRRGQDPLGDHFVGSVSPAERREQGATFTPPWVVELQLDRIAAKCGGPARVVDAGAGTGRYAIAAARRWPRAEVIAIEKDPDLAQAAKITAAVAKLPNLTVICADYLALSLPPSRGVTAFVGNPPYVRHHNIAEKTKRWYADSMDRLGMPGNQLAGLHIYFLLKSLLLSRPGDVGCFITSSEWFDNGYGEDARAIFGRIGGDHLIRANPTEQIFADALTTSVISEWTLGSNSPVQFSDLVGRRVEQRFQRDREQLLALHKWPGFGRQLPGANEGAKLGDFFKISRGQVTGCNEVFIANVVTTPWIPDRYLFPCITDAQEIIRSTGVLRSARGLRRVIDLPDNLDDLSALERVGVEHFLNYARSMGAHKTHVAEHRTPWWRVRLKTPPPIVMTYMGRRPPVFARNMCGARLLNIAHSLSPLQPMSVAELERWVQWLNMNVEAALGRTYGGGLIKFEPREAEKIPVPTGGLR